MSGAPPRVKSSLTVGIALRMGDMNGKPGMVLRKGDADDAERILFGHIRRTRLELSQHPDIFTAIKPE